MKKMTFCETISSCLPLPRSVLDVRCRKMQAFHVFFALIQDKMKKTIDILEP